MLCGYIIYPNILDGYKVYLKPTTIVMDALPSGNANNQKVCVNSCETFVRAQSLDDFGNVETNF
jgi:hypothetical protein